MMGLYLQKINKYINNITVAIYIYIYELCVTKYLCNEACDSEFDYPWPNICDSYDTENLSSVANLNDYEISWNEKKKRQMINDTTGNKTIIAIPLNWYVIKRHPIAAGILMTVIQLLSCKGSNTELSSVTSTICSIYHPWQL